jgi:hypothetical protein
MWKFNTKRKLLGSVLQKLCPTLRCYVYDNVWGLGCCKSKVHHLFYIFLLIPSLSMKQGSLFCFVVMRSRMLRIMFLLSLESSWSGRVHGLWFHDVRTCGAKVLEYWMISLLKIKLNHENFGGIGMCLFVSLERSWWAGFIGIYLVRSGFKMWEILILNWFLLLKIQNHFFI